MFFTIGSGVWNQTALINPNEPTTSLFGCSIKLSENANVLIVGAKESNNFEGRVFVYTKVGNDFNLKYSYSLVMALMVNSLVLRGYV